MMSKIEQYAIVTSLSIQGLADLVTRQLEQGFEPLGGPFTIAYPGKATQVCQAMIKYEVEYKLSQDPNDKGSYKPVT
jgi:hypothetical protein